MTERKKAPQTPPKDGPNPIFTCLAGAGYETTRALRLFLGDKTEGAKKQFSELSEADRAEMVDDAMQVVAGATPPDLYKKYWRGVAWEALDPMEKVFWTLFCATVQMQYTSIQHVAAASQPTAPKGGDDGGA